ncbi:MAG: hypothetical protein IJS61_00680 [Firmicutes bacterium]|nr:hypothetical protein [Bacillota bacterium]
MVYYCDYPDRDILERACALIDALTFGRIREEGYENLSSFQRENIRLAALAQCKAMEGGEVTLPLGVKSFSLEDYTVSFGENGGGIYSYIDKSAYIYLMQTGLMCRKL